jgi:hypothetical protein
MRKKVFGVETWKTLEAEGTDIFKHTALNAVFKWGIEWQETYRNFVCKECKCRFTDVYDYSGHFEGCSIGKVHVLEVWDAAHAFRTQAPPSFRDSDCRKEDMGA